MQKKLKVAFQIKAKSHEFTTLTKAVVSHCAMYNADYSDVIDLDEYPKIILAATTYKSRGIELPNL